MQRTNGHKTAGRIIAIDPGNVQSAWVLFDTLTSELRGFGLEPNANVLERLDEMRNSAEALAIEQIRSYGMAVGKTVFDTVEWAGRFIERWKQGDRNAYHVTRQQVKLYLCGQTRAKDSNVMHAICDLYGGDRKKAVGTKATPGPLYGVSKDVWAALGVALTFADGSGKAAPSVIA